MGGRGEREEEKNELLIVLVQKLQLEETRQGSKEGSKERHDKVAEAQDKIQVNYVKLGDYCAIT